MNKTGLGQEELEAMLKAETRLNGAGGGGKGFADTLEPEPQAAACVNQNKLKDYQNMPEQIKNLFGPRAEAPAKSAATRTKPTPRVANLFRHSKSPSNRWQEISTLPHWPPSSSSRCRQRILNESAQFPLCLMRFLLSVR